MECRGLFVEADPPQESSQAREGQRQWRRVGTQGNLSTLDSEIIQIVGCISRAFSDTIFKLKLNEEQLKNTPHYY